MKLLYITNGITGAGGLERVLSVKASVLAEEFGYEVHILTLNETDKKPFYAFSGKVFLHSIEAGGNSLQYIRSYVMGIRKMVKAVRPDIISVCDDGLKGFFLPLILRGRTPLVYERHVSKLIELSGKRVTLRHRLKFRLMDQLSRHFDRFVVLTEGNASEWNTKHLTVIPNPLSFFPEEPAELNNRKIIAVGKQGYQKAYDLLLKSWSLAEDKGKWTLHLYGKKAPEAGLGRLAKTLGVEDSVYFHEPTQDIQQKYLDSSIFVLSSRFEGFGMVIIEAMACGLPVVSFDCPYGPSDILTDGADGFLVENGNTAQFAARLQQLMSDGELRHRMGSAGRENVEKYLPETVVKEWDVLFRSLVKKEK